MPGAAEEHRQRWFLDHVVGAATDLREFCAAAGRSMDGGRVLDLGCGDGCISLGLVLATEARRIVGVDVVPTDVEELTSLSQRYRGSGLPDELSFESCGETTLPFADDSFEAVVSWSAFEHVARPVEVLAEVHRVLRPDGFLFVQIWPLYHSATGSHLEVWHPDPFVHLRRPAAELRREVAGSEQVGPDVTAAFLNDFDTLNHITVDRLHRSLQAAGFRIVRAELLTGPTAVPEGVEDVPLVDLLVAGVKLVAVPR